MKVIVAGAGSIGRRHIANLRTLGVKDIVVLEPDAGRRAFAVQKLRCRAVASLKEALSPRPAAAVICTPPSSHASLAVKLLAARVPCFIEKPLAHRPADAAAILRAARRSRTVAAVGYQLRQAPALQWILRVIKKGTLGRLLYVRAEAGQYLPDWRPWQDYRKSYTARRSLGGGVLRDHSHEIDLVRWLAGDVRKATCVARRLSRLNVDVEDTAELTLELDSGVLASLHLDMIQRAYKKGCRFVFEKGTIDWDYPSDIRIYTAASKAWKKRRLASRGADFYVAEMRLFLKSAGAGRLADGLVSVEDAARTLDAVSAAERSSRLGRTVRLP